MAQVTTRKRPTSTGEIRWEYRFEGLPVHGKRRQISKGGYKTKKEADQAGNAAYKLYYDTGEVFRPAKVTYGDFVVKYLQETIYPGKSRSTIRGYENALAKILPALGDRPISTITPTQVLDVYNLARNDGYSNGILLKMRTILYKSFRQAVTLRYIIKDPCYNLDFPSSLKDPKAPVAMLPADLQAMIDCFPPEDYRRIILAIAVYTGARESEIGGLTMDDVDLENRTIRYDHQVQKIYGHENDGGLWSWDATKTKSSIRTNTIGDALVEEIKTALHFRDARKEALGNSYKIPVLDRKTGLITVHSPKAAGNPDALDLLCPKPDGSPCGHNVYGEIAKYLRRRGYEGFHLHTCRHSHVTILLDGGENPVEVAARVGHSKPTTTLNTYAHSTRPGQQHAADTFESAMVPKEE